LGVDFTQGTAAPDRWQPVGRSERRDPTALTEKHPVNEADDSLDVVFRQRLKWCIKIRWVREPRQEQL
jgi:hypothetical protein